MGILTKEVEVKVNSYTIKYYESLGYEIPMRKASKSTFRHTGKELAYDLNSTFMVKVEDLQRRSNVKIDATCDSCGEIVNNVIYEHYCESIEKFGNYVCYKCQTIHRKESCLKSYGVDNPAKLKEVRNRMVETSLQRYGTVHPLQSNEIKGKQQQTVRNTYGVGNVSQLPEVREKISRTLYANSSQKTSKQQFYIFNLYQSVNSNIQLNYPIAHYNADICIPDEKLDIEIDFGGHNLSVKTGRISQEEFDRKELIRNNIIKREGYKIMRIISSKDFIPPDDILLQMLDFARNYFSTTSHTWITYDIDQSLMFNAEHKQGIPYDFGSLRTVKDKEVI